MNIFKKLFSKKSRTPEDGIFFETIKQIINDTPINLEPYKRAFTHRSMNKIDENGQAINYDYIVINDEVDNAADRIMAIIRAEHAKCSRTLDEYLKEKLEEHNKK